MSGRHRFDHRHLHVHGTNLVHRLAPEAKLAGLIAFVATVAVTPRHWVAAFAVDAAILAAVIVVAGLPASVVAGRLAAIIPFVAFAVVIPFVGEGEQVHIGGLGLSVDGLWATWNIVAKAAIGATAAIVVTATTPVPDLLAGLHRLRVPAVIVAIMAFMFRYLDLVIDQLARMRRSMTARGHDPRWLWQAGPIAASAGTLFVRTYERGERVHDAMIARGYRGAMPELHPRRPAGRDWTLALQPAIAAGVITIAVGLT
jgi:cobalt/nickel transport system permease protein